MTALQNRRLRLAARLALLFCALTTVARADVLVATNDERFVGHVLELNQDAVIFESEVGGRLTIPRVRIRNLEINPPTVSADGLTKQAAITNALAGQGGSKPAQAATNLLSWLPPGIGRDKDDWVQFKSGEWLRGRFKYLQQKKVEFDSDEMDQLTLDLKDIWQIYPAEPMWARFDSRKEPVFGTIVLSNEVVTVDGINQLSLSRGQLIGITPSGINGIRDWSGDLSFGASLQSGNNNQTTLTTMGELARRTPNTELLLDYLGNYSEVNSQETANNQRIGLTYDIRFDRHWFWRAVQLEYYEDPLANIGFQGTASTAGGYYIFDQSGLTWYVAAGPGYQYTRFSTVEAGQSDTATTPAGVFYSKYKMDITRRLDFSLSYRGTFTREEAGEYTHHTVSKVSFEIKRHLNLDVSYIWDYSQNPQTKSSGTIPQKSDSYLTVGLGVRF